MVEDRSCLVQPHPIIRPISQIAITKEHLLVLRIEPWSSHRNPDPIRSRQGLVGFIYDKVEDGSADQSLASGYTMASEGLMSATQGGSKESRGEKIEEMLQGLVLRDDEEVEVVLEENLEELEADARWLALARVHTLRSFSHASFFGYMRASWRCAKDVEFRPVRDILFTVQFMCLADWERVMEDGPWLFRDCPVIMVQYDGWSDVDSVELVHYPAWVRVMDLKERMRTGSIAMQPARKAGSVIRLDEMSVKGQGEGVRVGVMLDATKPLSRAAPIKLSKGKCYFRLVYEKMPAFCGVCGLVGHVTKEHGDGIHEPSAIQYKGSLIAPEFRRKDWVPGGGGGSRGRGGGGRGWGGRRSGWTDVADEWDDDLRDTSSSLGKKTAERTSISANKRRLEMPDDPLGQVPGTMPMLTDYPHVQEEGVEGGGDGETKSPDHPLSCRDRWIWSWVPHTSSRWRRRIGRVSRWRRL